MIRKLLSILAVAALAVSGSAAAHEGHKHATTHKMMGTVKAVHTDMNHVEITTTKGTASGFYVDTNTKYVRGSSKLTLADLTPGTRVVVTAKGEGEKMTAVEVRFSGRAVAAAKTNR
jgi:hypothetical protein